MMYNRTYPRGEDTAAGEGKVSHARAKSKGFKL